MKSSPLFLSICVFFLLVAGDLHLIHADEDDSNANFLRLPSSVAAVNAITNIIGRDGLCLDVANDNYADGTPIRLWPCTENRRNQLWSFESDGTIRSNGKCMITSASSIGSYAMIYDCGSVAADIRSRWTLNYLGSIIHFSSGLALSSLTTTAPEGLSVTLARDEMLPFQAWTAVNYAKPEVTYISGGPNGYCLNSDNSINPYDYVRVRCCQFRVEPKQQWAIYGDRTIRFFSNRGLCLTSYGLTTLSYIGLRACQGLPTQRWNFMSDARILNPSSGFYLNVYGLVELNIIPLATTPRQEWFTMA